LDFRLSASSGRRLTGKFCLCLISVVVLAHSSPVDRWFRQGKKAAAPLDRMPGNMQQGFGLQFNLGIFVMSSDLLGSASRARARQREREVFHISTWPLQRVASRFIALKQILQTENFQFRIGIPKILVMINHSPALSIIRYSNNKIPEILALTPRQVVRLEQ